MEVVEPKKSKGHRCYFCGKRFLNIHILRKHVTTHKDRDIFCDVCGKDFTSSWGLKKHMKVHTGERPHRCNFCEKTFRQKSTLQSHIKAVHSIHSLPLCRTCGKKLRSYVDIQCWLCKYEERPLLLDTHGIENVEVSNENSNSTPEEIKNVDASTSSLDIDPVECIITTSSNNYKPTLEKHQRSFSCNMCRKTKHGFSTIAELKQHQLNHHYIDRPFKCEHCGSGFRTLFAMQQHVVVHSDLRPYVCMTCNKRFKTTTCLKQHLQTHREDRPCVCKVCGNSFKTLCGLKQHLVTHNDECSFVCKDCGIGFKSSQRLKNHVIIVHTNENPMKCDYCERIFHHAGNLKRHIRIHTGERPYICQTCGKTFAQSSSLKAHQLIHNKDDKNIESHTCSLCVRHFRSFSNLRKHMSIHL